MEKITTRSRSSFIAKGILAMAGMAWGMGALQGQTTGFNQGTAGPFDYDNTANWVGGAVNGIWDSSLTLTAAQAVTFDSDYVLGTGLTFNYAGNFALTLRGDGTNRTITLGGDISVAPASNQTVTFGSATAGQNLNVDLGGVSRTFTVNPSKTLAFANVISNGSIVKAGVGTLTLTGANLFAGGVTLNDGILNVNNNAALGTGTLTINGGTLNVNGARTTTNIQNWNGDFTFTGGNSWNIGTGAVTLGSDRQVTVSNNTLTVGGAIGDSGSGYGLTKAGAGIMVLNGVSTYSGGTAVTGGTLTVGAAGNLGANTSGNDVTVSGGILNLGAATNIGSNQALTVESTSSSLGVLGLAFNSLPAFTQSGADPIVVAINAAGFTAISDQSLVGNGNIFLGSTGTGTYAGTALGAGADETYRLGGGGGTLTVTNGVLSGANDLVVGSTLANGGGTVLLQGTNDLSGSTAVNGGSLRLSGASGSLASSDITVTSGATLNFNSSTAGVTGATRAASVNLKGGNLTLNGNNTAASIDSVSGAINIDGHSPMAGINYITLSPGTQNARLSAQSLTRSNGGVVQISGANLGAAPANGVANFVLTGAAPALVGGSGGAGTATMKILPWAIGSTTANQATDFITYDANGFRPLAANEYATSITDGATTENNVKITAAGATNIALTGTTTVNSLYLVAGQAGSGINISGSTLAVTSGVVFLSNPNGGVTVASHLDFGSAQGVIGYSRGKATSISGGLSGSGGMVFYQPAGPPADDSGGTGLSVTGASDYTGDTYVLGKVTVTNNILPNSSRTGDVYVYGVLEYTGNILSINGLNGEGLVDDQSSSGGTITFGGNNANGNFSGRIAQNGPLNLVKTGTGTQVLGGTSNHTGTTTVSAGTLLINGNFASAGAATVSNTATFGGSGGTWGGAVNVSAGGTLAPGASIGTLVTGTVNAAADSILAFELQTASPDSDLLSITGDLNLALSNDSILTLSILGTDTVLGAGVTFTLATYSGAWNGGLFEYNGSALADGEIFSLGLNSFLADYNDSGAFTLTTVAVPEPSTYVLVFGGLGALYFLRRNKAKQS